MRDRGLRETQMKFAISTLGCPAWDVERVAEAAKTYGYQGVELRVYQGEVISADMPGEERRQVRQVFERRGVDICCVSASTRFSSSDASERAKQEDELRRYVDLANDLGAPLVRTFGGMLPPNTPEETVFAYAGESLQRVAERVGNEGARIVLETHDAFSSGRTVSAVLQHVPSATVGALWDTHHPYRTGESAEETYGLLAERLYHIHVKDARRQGDGWQLVLLGEGEVPVREVLRTLAQHGYDGWISVEWEKMWHPEIEDPDVAFPQHLRKMQEYLA